jgi:hypothetical protein
MNIAGCEQFCHGHVDRLCQLLSGGQRDVPFGALDGLDKGPIQPSNLGQRLLRPAVGSRR